MSEGLGVLALMDKTGVLTHLEPAALDSALEVEEERGVRKTLTFS